MNANDLPTPAPTDRKTRSDARLDHLDPAILADLHQWLDDDLPLETIAAQLQDTHQITVSLSTLSRYRHRRLLHERQTQAAAQAELLAQLATRDLLPLNADPARLQATLHLFFLLQAFESADLKAYLAVSRLELARRNLELRQRQLDFRQSAQPGPGSLVSAIHTLRALRGRSADAEPSASAEADPDPAVPSTPYPNLADRRSADRRSVPVSANTCKQPQTPPPQAPANPTPDPNLADRRSALPDPADTFHPLPGPAPTFRPTDPALLARVAEICRGPVPFADATPHPTVHINRASNRPAA